MSQDTGRRFANRILVIATHNAHKLSSYRLLFRPFGIRLLSAEDADLEEPEETGQTFEENAKLKALLGARNSGLPCLGDDSGLCVEALDGAPGIFSARWAGPEKDFRLAIRRVEDALQDLSMAKNQTLNASFRCAIALAWPDDHLEIATGHVSGQLTFPPRGDHGFGYDPIFIPNDGDNRTFGEMSEDEKTNLSHRNAAFQALRKKCLPGVGAKTDGEPG